MRFLAAIIVAAPIVAITALIKEVCAYTPMWLDYAICILSLASFIYFVAGDRR